VNASNPAPIQTLPLSNDATVGEIAKFFDKHGDVWRLAYDNEIERWNQYFPLRRREAWALEEIQNEFKGLAVDLGCGTGHALIKMHHLGFQRIMGIDISDDMLATRRRQQSQ
jgi:SAM-dependent methyltransferase